MGKGKVSAEELDYRLSETARLLVRRRSYLDVERELAGKFSVDRRTARKWIKKVKDQWRATAVTEDADDHRADLIQQLDAVIASGWGNTEVVRDADGNPVLDMNPTLANGQPNPGYQRPLVRSVPKIQHVLHAVSQLRALTGADKPTSHHVKLDADINAMPDVDALPEAVQAELRAQLEKLGDGDLRKLAGDWFHDTNPKEPPK